MHCSMAAVLSSSLEGTPRGSWKTPSFTLSNKGKEIVLKCGTSNKFSTNNKIKLDQRKSIGNMKQLQVSHICLQKSFCSIPFKMCLLGITYTEYSHYVYMILTRVFTCDSSNHIRRIPSSIVSRHQENCSPDLKYHSLAGLLL